MTILAQLADIAEDLLLFGMKPPCAPPRSFRDVRREAASWADEAPPLETSWQWDAQSRARMRSRETESANFMWQSIRLVLMSRRMRAARGHLSARVGDALQARADWIFEAYCSVVPRWVLCEWLLDNPPPPPHWEVAIQHAVSFIDAGARIGGEIGDKLQEAGAQIIGETLELQSL